MPGQGPPAPGNCRLRPFPGLRPLAEALGLGRGPPALCDRRLRPYPGLRLLAGAITALPSWVASGAACPAFLVVPNLQPGFQGQHLALPAPPEVHGGHVSTIMGGGDLNLKESWHPQTLRNVEKVWKAEQKHVAERRKIEELQRELREERAREEMQCYAEDVGAVKKKEEKLDWMYQGPGGMVNRDEYLLGRPADKYVFEKMEKKEAGCSSETGLLPGSIFAPSGANSLLDLASKIPEDPLFIIRKKEEEKKREVLNNPVKMKKIKELLQMSLEKKEKKKEKKKQHKKQAQKLK
ncbi:Pre-mRNA-splicing factor CWC25 like protein [Myotis davidii]|uniref:Pre-mRNA-splicing factor CWC25 like protein n=1 Tax=Myotis davidii TaxID=225400 RepID=L5MDR0_MYODS|nr:Pre-mRNA-splicing factor CWC25 like protein [Myotis davidii]